MNATRAIVLDVSGSMREGFRGDRRGRPARPTLADTKFEAALEYLWYVIENADPASDLLLVSFGIEAKQLYHGPITQRLSIQAALSDVGPNDQKTNLASALQLVADRMVDERSSGRETISLVDVITDGLINAGDPVPSAQHVQRQGGFITIYLIDDTPEGLSQARAIAGRQGRVEPVRTLSDFRRQYGVNVPAQEQALAFNWRMLENYRSARAAFMRSAESLERPFFTAAYPTDLPPARWSSLELFLYAKRLRASVEKEIKRLRQNESTDYASATSRLELALPVGSRVTVNLESDAFDINPEETTIRWLEEFYRLPFRIRAKDHPERQETMGSITARVFVDDLPVGTIDMRILITGQANVHSEQSTAELQWFHDVFASYAREDLAIVEHLRSRYAALGVFLSLLMLTICQVEARGGLI